MASMVSEPGAVRGAVRVVSEDGGDLLASLVVGGVEAAGVEVGRVLARSDEALFHEAGVWIAQSQEWLVTSDRIEGKVKISAISLDGTVRDVTEALSAVVMANGGTPDGQGGALVCSQGVGSVGGAIFRVDAGLTQAVSLFRDLTTNQKGHFPRNLMLNSPNDVVFHTPTGCILFTDPSYGHQQGFRASHNGIQALWCAEPTTSNSYRLYTLEEDFARPNGCLLSIDMQTVYVSDTGFFEDATKPRQIDAFDIVVCATGRKLKLANRRCFAKSQQGAPDGLKCDVNGNLYAGVGDGVAVFHSAPGEPGRRLGKLLCTDPLSLEPLACANLCFGGPDGKTLLLLCGNVTIALDMHVEGAL